jgi:LuxR family transcriptional regulator, maltose regulon positive regulatory protein
MDFTSHDAHPLAAAPTRRASPAVSWTSRCESETRPADQPLGLGDRGSDLPSTNTVKTHMRHLFGKLGAHRRGEAVARARALGVLAPGRARTASRSRQ